MTDDLYRGVTDFAHDTPDWLHAFAEFGTEGGLILLIALLALACWRSARPSDSPYGRAAALLAPCGLVVAYGISELTKLLVTEERPCRAVSDTSPSIAPCPEPGDWSFPSNHATLALAAGTGVVLLWRALAWLAVPVALLTAFSRVFVGVHYPHDVLVGGLLGVAVVALCAAATGPLIGPCAHLLLRRGLAAAPVPAAACAAALAAETPATDTNTLTLTRVPPRRR